MKKQKLMVVAGTRPELIRLSRVIAKCDHYFDLFFVHTGQNYDYELNEIFFQQMKLRRPDVYLNVAGENLGQTLGNVIARSYEVMCQQRPDAVLILGDTNSALAAISAKRLKIPIFHMEAGNRCWDYNVPEMINRKIVDHISDINLPYTEQARRYLLNEGIDGKTIFVTGSPMREALAFYHEDIAKSQILLQLGLENKKYILLSAHREENIDHEENFNSLMTAVNKIAQAYGLPILYSAHPRSEKRIRDRNFSFHPLVRIVKPFGFFDYVKLEMNAFCVLSDSGTLSEECSILGFPAVLIRTSTERPEALDAGSIVLGGIRYESIVQAMEMAVAACTQGTLATPDDYQAEHVSDQVVKLIQSYTQIVNITTWRKTQEERDAF